MCVCRFIPHLKNLIELGGEDSEWVDATGDPHLLSYAGLRKLGFNFKASTDILVAKRITVRAHQPGKGARVLFDIRRAVTGADIVDAEAKLVLANLHAPDEKPIMMRPAHSLRALKFSCSQILQRPARERAF